MIPADCGLEQRGDVGVAWSAGTAAVVGTAGEAAGGAPANRAVETGAGASLMARLRTDPVSLVGLVLPDVRGGAAVDLGTLAGPAVLTTIRHRY